MVALQATSPVDPTVPTASPVMQRSLIELQVTSPAPPTSPKASPVMQRSLLDDDILEPMSLAMKVLQPETISERVQSASYQEALTRNFRSTMRQHAGAGTGAGKGKAKAKKQNTFAGRLEVPEWSIPLKNVQLEDEKTVDPLPEFLKDINQRFNDMVDSLRGFRGELQIQVDFGRIILHKLNPKQMSGSDKVMVKEAASIRNMLLQPTAYGPTSHFTKVVTTKAGEMPYMLEMKARSALLWEQDVTSWNVVYEFTFFEKLTGVRFMIEIDAESFVTQVKMKHDLGVIYIHGTQRYHDMQISATGYETESAGKSYGRVADALEKSLWIP